MDTPQLRPPKDRGAEIPVPHVLQLHPAPHRLRDAVHPAQRLHLHRIVRRAPREQARLERVGRHGRGDRPGRGGRGAPGRREGQVVAEGVREARGGGGALGWVGSCWLLVALAVGGVGREGGVVGWGGDAEGLFSSFFIFR